jgi:hypothetical protein
MKFQPLEPWVKGNTSITPENFYGRLKPNLEMGAYISIDIEVELYLANTVDTGNLKDSWKLNKEYIERASELTGADAECGFDLDNEEKRWILDELGEPPRCCYNLYFITIYNEVDEKLVYVGKTDSKKGRFINGHIAALKLHNPKYQRYNKRIYFGTIMFLSEIKEYIPLEFITPYSIAERYLGEMEALLIERLNPELNVKSERMGELKNLSVVHIQNYSGISSFMNDFFVY